MDTELTTTLFMIIKHSFTVSKIIPDRYTNLLTNWIGDAESSTLTRVMSEAVNPLSSRDHSRDVCSWTILGIEAEPHLLLPVAMDPVYLPSVLFRSFDSNNLRGQVSVSSKSLIYSKHFKP